MSIYLEDLVKRKGALTEQQLKQVKQWLDDDWEANDIDQNAVKLIARLMATLTVHGVIE